MQLGSVHSSRFSLGFRGRYEWSDELFNEPSLPVAGARHLEGGGSLSRPGIMTAPSTRHCARQLPRNITTEERKICRNSGGKGDEKGWKVERRWGGGVMATRGWVR